MELGELSNTSRINVYFKYAPDNFLQIFSTSCPSFPWDKISWYKANSFSGQLSRHYVVSWFLFHVSWLPWSQFPLIIFHGRYMITQLNTVTSLPAPWLRCFCRYLLSNILYRYWSSAGSNNTTDTCQSKKNVFALMETKPSFLDTGSVLCLQVCETELS